MPVIQSSNFNQASLVVDGLYTVVTPPGGTIVQGVATGIGGFVGGASWGPVNVPVSLGTTADSARVFGPAGLGANDMPTDIAVAFQQGMGSAVGVRVTDGSDTAATGVVTEVGTAATGTVTATAASGGVVAGQTLSVTVNGLTASYTTQAGDTASSVATGLASAIAANVALATLISASTNAGELIMAALAAGISGNSITLAVTSSASVTLVASGATFSGGAAGATIFNLEALYTGTEGDNLSATMVAGANSTAAAPTWTLQLTRTGIFSATEVYPNLPQSSLATSVINALANGINNVRGPSQLAKASVGSAPTAAPQTGVSFALSGGSNGDSNITSAQQLGSNTSTPMTGMYALASQGVQQFCLCGNTDKNAWALEVTWAEDNGALAVLAFPANTTTDNAIALKSAAGIDSEYAAMINDWVQFNDTWNGQLRLISPAAFVVGKVAALSPQFSPGNKPMNIITATSRTLAMSPYSDAELGKLFSNGIIVITNPCPGGKFFGLRSGLNASSNSTINGIEYTRMTNFLAYSIQQSFGIFVDLPQTTTSNDPLRSKASANLSNFLSGLQSQSMIQAFNVDMSFGEGKVNTTSSVEAGFMIANVPVQYMNTARFFVVNLVGGRTVNVSVQ